MSWNNRARRSQAVLLAAIMMLASGLVLTAGEEPRYTLVDLGELEVGGHGACALAINGSSQVVGYSYVAQAFIERAFLVTPEDSDGNGVPDTWFRDANGDGINDLMIDLGTLGRGDGSSARSIATGINDSGQVVGFSTTDDFVEGDGGVRQYIYRAFIITPETDADGNRVWFRDGGGGVNALMVDLGRIGGEWTTPSSASMAYGISNSGYVVGQVSAAGWEADGHAFIVAPETDGGGNLVWFRDTNGDGFNDLMLDLGTLGVLSSRADGVNDSGQVVGQSFGYTSSGWWARGFIITPETDAAGKPVAWFRDNNSDGVNDLMVELEPIRSGADSGASAISSSGQIIGTSDGHAVRWEVDAQGNTTATDLGKVKGERLTTGTSINDAGQAVGFGHSTSGGGVTRTAFLWENGKMTKLIDLIANGEGILGLKAFGINENGAIAGVVNGDGYEHAYIAVPSAQGPSPLEITTTSLPDAIVGEPYSATLEAAGGTPPYTWSIVDGILPGELALDPNTGVISGTASVEDTQAFTAEVMDAVADTATQPLSITVSAASVVDVTVVSVVATDIGHDGKYNITATVRNEGLASVTVHVDCRVDGSSGAQTLRTRSVALAPGAAADVRFNDKSKLSLGACTATVTVQEDSTATGSDTFLIE